MDMNRRDAFAGLAAMALLAKLGAAQTGAAASGVQEAAKTQNTDLAPVTSQVFHFDALKASTRPGGGWGRPVMHGTLPTGEFVELHETGLGPGMEPHPAHKHRNTEFLLIREGTLEYTGDGKVETVGPGDVIYSASMVMHGIKNVGTTVATYFVVSISHGQM